MTNINKYANNTYSVIRVEHEILCWNYTRYQKQIRARDLFWRSNTNITTKWSNIYSHHEIHALSKLTNIISIHMYRMYRMQSVYTRKHDTNDVWICVWIAIDHPFEIVVNFIEFLFDISTILEMLDAFSKADFLFISHLHFTTWILCTITVLKQLFVNVSSRWKLWSIMNWFSSFILFFMWVGKFKDLSNIYRRIHHLQCHCNIE